MHDALDDDCVTFADLINPGDFNLSDLGQDLPPPPPELLTRYIILSNFHSELYTVIPCFTRFSIMRFSITRFFVLVQKNLFNMVL